MFGLQIRIIRQSLLPLTPGAVTGLSGGKQTQLRKHSLPSCFCNDNIWCQLVLSCPDANTGQTLKFMGFLSTFMSLAKGQTPALLQVCSEVALRSEGWPGTCESCFFGLTWESFARGEVAAKPKVHERAKHISLPCSVPAPCSRACDAAGKRMSTSPGLTVGAASL